MCSRRPTHTHTLFSPSPNLKIQIFENIYNNDRFPMEASNRNLNQHVVLQPILTQIGWEALHPSSSLQHAYKELYTTPPLRASNYVYNIFISFISFHSYVGAHYLTTHKYWTLEVHVLGNNISTKLIRLLQTCQLFIGSVCRIETMHRLLCFKSKFPNHFAFTLGHYLFLLFLV